MSKAYPKRFWIGQFWTCPKLSSPKPLTTLHACPLRVPPPPIRILLLPSRLKNLRTLWFNSTRMYCHLARTPTCRNWSAVGPSRSRRRPQRRRQKRQTSSPAEASQASTGRQTPFRQRRSPASVASGPVCGSPCGRSARTWYTRGSSSRAQSCWTWWLCTARSTGRRSDGTSSADRAAGSLALRRPLRPQTSDSSDALADSPQSVLDTLGERPHHIAWPIYCKNSKAITISLFDLPHLFEIWDIILKCSFH